MAEAQCKWLRQTERDRDLRPGLTTDGRRRLKELERMGSEVRRPSEILRKASVRVALAELDSCGR